MKVLFIGNSYTYYNGMPDMLEAIAGECGEELTADSITKGARRLAENLSADEIALRVRTAILTGGYDAIFLQEQSQLPFKDYGSFFEGVSGLSSLAPKGTGIVLYQTWARAEGCPLLEELGMSREEMHFRLREAYAQAAEAVGARVSPAGDAFFSMEGSMARELYDPDMSHPSVMGSALAAAVHFRTLFGRPADRCASVLADQIAAEAVLSIAREVRYDR